MPKYDVKKNSVSLITTLHGLNATQIKIIRILYGEIFHQWDFTVGGATQCDMAEIETEHQNILLPIMVV